MTQKRARGPRRRQTLGGVTIAQFILYHARRLHSEDDAARAMAAEVLDDSLSGWEAEHEAEPTRHETHGEMIARWCRSAGLGVPPWVAELARRNRETLRREYDDLRRRRSPVGGQSEASPTAEASTPLPGREVS